MRFIASTFASIIHQRKNYSVHAPVVIAADSIDAANDKAKRLVEARYPRSKGWFDHHVMISSSLDPIEPDNIQPIDEGDLHV
jgi:hypothetical protein